MPPDMDIYEIHEDLEKFKKAATKMWNDNTLLDNNNLEKSYLEIIRFENKNKISAFNRDKGYASIL